jgi:hypothetical protein
MNDNRIFISYRREAPWVDMAAKFRVKLANYAQAWKLDYFIDSKQIAVGVPWRTSVETALAGCTHFLCLLCDSYWESTECRRELDVVLARRAAGEPVAPYFVLCEPMKPSYLMLRDDGQTVGDVSTVGDFNFLGPYDESMRRVSLIGIDRARWGESIEDMLSRLKPTLAR